MRPVLVVDACLCAGYERIMDVWSGRAPAPCVRATPSMSGGAPDSYPIAFYDNKDKSPPRIKQEHQYAADSASTGGVIGKAAVPCKVCGDKASGYHYGVTSCEGCKVKLRDKAVALVTNDPWWRVLSKLKMTRVFGYIHGTQQMGMSMRAYISTTNGQAENVRVAPITSITADMLLLTFPEGIVHMTLRYRLVIILRTNVRLWGRFFMRIRGFFRRSIQKQIEYRCLRDGKCLVIRLNRNRCQFCRFKKCLAVGMSRDSVRYGRVPKRSREATTTEPNQELPKKHVGPIPGLENMDPENFRDDVVREVVRLVTAAHRNNFIYEDDKTPNGVRRSNVREGVRQTIADMSGPSTSSTSPTPAHSSYEMEADCPPIGGHSVTNALCTAITSAVNGAFGNSCVGNLYPLSRPRPGNAICPASVPCPPNSACPASGTSLTGVIDMEATSFAAIDNNGNGNHEDESSSTSTTWTADSSNGDRPGTSNGDGPGTSRGVIIRFIELPMDLCADGSEVRTQLWHNIAVRMTPTVQQVVEFAKRLPGFQILPQDDQIILIKQGFYEIWLTRVARNSTAECISFDDGTAITRRQLITIYDHHFANAILTYVWSLNKLCASELEMALYTSILLLWPNRPGLSDPETISGISDAITDAFNNVELAVAGPDADVRMSAFNAVANEAHAIGARHNELLTWCRDHWPRLVLPDLFAEIFDIPKGDYDESMERQAAPQPEGSNMG